MPLLCRFWKIKTPRNLVKWLLKRIEKDVDQLCKCYGMNVDDIMLYLHRIISVFEKKFPVCFAHGIGYVTRFLFFIACCIYVTHL